MERVTQKEIGSSSSTSSSSSNRKQIPDSVMEAVNRTSKNMDDLSSNVDELLSLYGAGVFPDLGPLQQAQSLILLAKATTTLFALRLRCKGINPDDRPVKLEFERLSLFQQKLQELMDLNKAPLQPSARINPQGAARFIEHSLPDLTPEQRKGMREISKADGPRIKYLERVVHKKRKYSEQQSVRTATQEFLEKAARELLGEKQSGFKGPLQLPEGDDEDIPMS